MRYYFHLREAEEFVLDEEGREFPDIEAVKAAAIADARSVISAEACEGKLPLRAMIEVEDAGGEKVFQLKFRDAVIVDG